MVNPPVHTAQPTDSGQPTTSYAIAHKNGTFSFPGIHFIQSATKIQQLPANSGCEVAFIGRSNVGKSSTINSVCSKKIAKVGNTPGKTKLFNLFALDKAAQHRVMDLPGYGYAQVSKTERRDWQERFVQYLNERSSLRGLFLIMDARHPYQASDKLMLELLIQHGRTPVCILCNKIDKLTRNEILSLQKKIDSKAYSPFHQIFPHLLFGAHPPYSPGIVAAQYQLLQWLTPS